MQDALNLGRGLAVSNRSNVKDHLKVYQDEILARGAEAVKNSRAATDQTHGRSGGERIVWGQPVKVTDS